MNTETTPRKIYIIAGEASGDLHGSNVIRELLQMEASLNVRCWGGDLMQKAGGEVVKHIRELAFMGFQEVLMNIRTILRNMKECKADIEKFKPDALLLIDYPGFNLRIAEWAKEKGIPVYYYVSPQVWAWKQSRVYKLRKVVDHMFVILPFEKAFYEKFDYSVEFVGHPLLDEIHRYEEEQTAMNFKARNQLLDTPIIAILPGSRRQEIAKKLPIMLKSVHNLSGYQIVVAGAPSMDQSFYADFLPESTKIVFGQTYDLLANSTAALVTSGTATLEAALFQVPEVVCYKSSALSYQIAKRLVKIKYISLVNLIMDREVVKELIQDDCTSAQISVELTRILPGGESRSQMEKDFKELRQLLGGGGASKKVAQSLLKTIQRT
jgi:lipid-A-disaccharide synthase